MLISEFVERTGFEPTADEYVEIEEAYYKFDGDKDAFCRDFVANGSEKQIYKARAEKIATLKSQMVELKKMFKQDLAERERKISRLETELDKEQVQQ